MDKNKKMTMSLVWAATLLILRRVQPVQVNMLLRPQTQPITHRYPSSIRNKATEAEIDHILPNDIILYEQKKKETVRSRSKEGVNERTEKNHQVRNNSLEMSQLIRMTSPDSPGFDSQRVETSYKRMVRLNEDSILWLKGADLHPFNNRSKINHCRGIPLVNKKLRFQQNQNLGYQNSFMMRKEQQHGRQQHFNAYNGYNSNLLTTRNLDHFNMQQNYDYKRKRRGPNSLRSCGSRSGCSRISHSSVRSQSNNIRLYSSDHNRSERFMCELDPNIFDAIKLTQKRRIMRIRNTPRENLNLDARNCRPVPESTRISLNYRFRQFISNPMD